MSFKIDLKIFFFLIVFYFTKQISIYSYMMIFAIIHEFAHCFAGLIVGMKPENIMITPLGFSVKFKIMEDEYNKRILKSNRLEIKKIVIAMTGPAINFFLVLMLSVVNLAGIDKQIAIYSNILIAIFNLMPIHPLDGGRILKSFLNLYVGRKKAYTYIQLISKCFMFVLTFIGSILIYYYKNIAIFFIIIYLWSIVIRENKFCKMKLKFYEMIEG